ncbi:MAG TPA: PstS family phosphate ABC transporter substrate-binding protein [Rubricoccaceae bacterium]|nr:PstS family phosphate ABC transporter substrate-binding protein [Rubricoccaceae bacterium]
MATLRLLLTATFVLALLPACGGGNDGSGLSGRVLIDGSSTVGPLSEAMAEEFMIANPNVRVTVGASGTGGGFAKFFRGEIDINDASRPVKAEEVAGGYDFIELPVAYDGLAIVTNPSNTFVECLTVDELRRVWAPNSAVNNWSQVRADFPSKPLTLFGAGTDSGTYDYFTEAIVGEEGASRADYTASEDDNVLVQGVAGDQGGLGFVPLSYYENNRERLRLVAVDGGSGCVTPSAQTVNNGTYTPLSRPLFIYVRADRATDPTVRAFVEFYLENAAALVESVGYVPLSEAGYAAARERFAAGTTGSVFAGGTQIGVTVEDLLRRSNGNDSAAAGSGAGPAPAPTPAPTDTAATR